jgi:thymidine kinase
MSGRLELIIGGMFSGKSSELIRRLKRYKAIDGKILVINSDKDTRSDSNVLQTHDRVIFDCIKVPNLIPLIEDQKYQDANIIGIDEAQFFPNLVKFVKLALQDNKYIIVAGLDGDFKQEIFGEILYLIPLCDDVHKLKALCMECKNGTEGPFTKRIDSRDKSQELVGATEYYKAVCRSHLEDENVLAYLLSKLVDDNFA